MLNKLFREAKRLLTEVGWTQGAHYRNKNGTILYFGDEATCFCLRGALLEAFNRLNLQTPVFIKAEKILNDRVIPRGYSSYIGWNDNPGRTVGEVVELLDVCIRKTDGQDEAPPASTESTPPIEEDSTGTGSSIAPPMD